MPKFRTKPTIVEAVQWDGKTPHEAVEAHHGELIYSRNGTHYYVYHLLLNPTAWVPLSGEDKDILPFAFYEVKSGRKVPLNELAGLDLDLVNASLKNYNPTPTLEQLEPWGYIKTSHGDLEVRVGDWIISGPQGFERLKNSVFTKIYEPVEDEPMQVK